MRSAKITILASLAIFSSAMGCELIAQADRDKIPDNGSGGSAGAGGEGQTSSSSSSGQGGTAGEGGQGGTGGSACTKNSDCPATGTVCATAVCNAGTCEVVNAGISAPCSDNGGTLCDGQGACVQCLTPLECAPAETCHVIVCDAGKCTYPFATAGFPAGNATVGDCQVEQCDGAGMVVSATDNADLPAPMNECKVGVCTAGSPSIQNAPMGTDCGMNGTSCDGMGNCVGCMADADCGMPSDCSIPKCTNGVCGQMFVTEGTPVPMQMPNDCKAAQCDGAGGIKQVNDDGDVPMDDGNPCTDNLCNAGMPDFPNSSIGTECAQNGGTVCNAMGMCVECNIGTDCATGMCMDNVCAPPTVVSIDPADMAVGALVGSSIAVTFNDAMNPASLVGQTAIGPCTGSVQFSVDDFVTCHGFASAAPTMSAGDKTATFVPAPGLSFGTTYKVRVTTGATGASGKPLANAVTQTMGFTTEIPQSSCNGSVVISQVYAAGGDTGATFSHDFVELHNRGTTAVDLTNWSVQTTSGSGTMWEVSALSGMLEPGDYYLVQLASAGANGTALPMADASSTASLTSGSGKVALVSNTTALSVDCPTGATIRDLIGYGAAATCAEGMQNALAESTTTAVHRRNGGCVDTNVNLADTEILAPSPRNTATTALQCACPVGGALGTANESNTSVELDYCKVQFPLSIMVTAGQMTPMIYGRVYEAGMTEAMGANAAISAEVGFGPANVNPTTQSGYQFFSTTFNMQYGNDDEYMGSFAAPAVPGDYRYVYRFTLDGSSWTYCDKNGSGANGGLSFETHELPVLTVMP